jgi:hypothetical protein
MPLTPNEHDAAAGFSETLTAVAVHHYESGSDDAVPWVDLGSAGINRPYEVDHWLQHDVPGWEEGSVNYLVHVVPEVDYKTLRELGVRGVTELSTLDFIATKEDVARVREATARQHEERGEGNPA